MGSRGKPRESGSTSNSSSTYSDVDRRATPISEDDIQQIGHSSHRYFQSSNSFEMNEALRAYADGEFKSLEEAIRAKAWSSSRADGYMTTIETMDRNMQPINKDMRVLRLVDDEYTDKVFSTLGISDDTLRAIHNMNFFGRLSDGAISEIRDKILGARVTEAGFMSSTYNFSLNDSAFKGRRIALDFNVPQGTHGMFSPTGEESEFVFARNTKYEFTDVAWDNKNRRLVLSVNIVRR